MSSDNTLHPEATTSTEPDQANPAEKAPKPDDAVDTGAPTMSGATEVPEAAPVPEAPPAAVAEGASENPAGEPATTEAATSEAATSEAAAQETSPPTEAAPLERPRPQLNPTQGRNSATAVPNLGGGAGGPSGEAPPVDIPPTVDLDAEMQAEIEAAMSSGELDPIGIAPAATEGAAVKPAARAKPPEEELAPGVRLTAKIQSVHGDDVFLDLGYRAPGITQARQFDANKKPEVGQVIEVVVDKIDAANTLIVCNLPRSRRKGGGNWESLAADQIVDCMVTKTNKGGLEITVSNLRGFLPASQIELGFVADMEGYVGQKLRVQITEVNPKKRNLVVSRKILLQSEREEAEEVAWKTLEVGQKFTGLVKTIKDYGAFIDIGGIDGFLHIGEMSWTRVRHPSDVLKEGMTVEVQVLTLDREKKRIGLGLKQLAQNPWSRAAETYAVGSTVNGKVTRTADFGAFVELEPGLEGLIHISELDHKRVRKVEDLLKVGQAIDAKVLEVDLDRRRISLSLKALTERPVEVKVADEDLAPSASAPAFVNKRRGPLKGGTGGTSGGGMFGNPRDFQ